MNPIRILAIAPTSFFADYGCHVRIRGQMAALQMRGHQVLLVTYPSGRDVEDIRTERVPWAGRKPIQVGSSRRKLVLDALLCPTVFRAARRFRPQLIHGYLHEGALLGALAARCLRIPLVFDYQGSLTAEMLDHRFISSGSPWLRLFERLERWIDRQPDAVLASSQHAVSGLLHADAEGRRRQIVLLHDSVSTRHFRPKELFPSDELHRLRESLSIPAGATLMVYLGLLAPYQGTEHLLRAVSLLVGFCPSVHLLLMGFPFVEHYRQRAAELGIASRVTFTGPVPYEDAPAHLALGQIAVAPKVSATEGSGKLLPYMAAALPVAAFDTPVQREYLGDLGEYAEPGDVAGLARAIATLLADPVSASERGMALRQVAEHSFTWEAAAGQIESIYEGLLAKSGPMV